MSKNTRTRAITRVLLGTAIATVSAIGAYYLGAIALTRALQIPAVNERIRCFNRRALNPLTLRIASNRSRIYAALHHVGRRSGRAYTTPVVAEPLGEGFIIPLPYGTDVDWLRNVLAAGKCALTWNEEVYQLERPEVIEAKHALFAFPRSEQVIFARGGIKHFLVLRRVAAEAPQLADNAHIAPTQR